MAVNNKTSFQLVLIPVEQEVVFLEDVKSTKKVATNLNYKLGLHTKYF